MEKLHTFFVRVSGTALALVPNGSLETEFYIFIIHKYLHVFHIDLEAARVLVEKALGIALEPRNSSYRGGDYCSKKLESRDEIVLQVNND